MLELCQIIDSEGYQYCEDEPELKLIPFGEIFRVSRTKLVKCGATLDENLIFFIRMIFADLHAYQ